MKKREIKNGKKTEVIISEATDGVNRVRLIGNARAGEEECPWEEIDAYSGRFVVAGYRYDSNDTSNNYHPWIAYSTDGGKTWEKSETTSNEEQAHGRLRALAYGGGRFVVAGYANDSHPWIAYSTDGGKTWTPSTTTSEMSQSSGNLQALAYGGGRFVVAGYANDNHPWIAYSTDGGKTWTPSTTTSDVDQPHGRPQALAYGGGRFVVAGHRYDETNEEDNYHPWIAYSVDGGETWTPSTTTSDVDQPHENLQALAYGGGRFVVAGYAQGNNENNYYPWIAYSIDGGETWTPSTVNNVRGLLHAFAYGDGRFIVAGHRYGPTASGPEEENGHPWIAYSTNGGETWTPSTTTSEGGYPAGELLALAYGGGRFVVAGYNREPDTDENNHPWIAYSTDGGKTWTPSTTTSDVSQPHGWLQALAYAPDSYCWKFGKEEEEKED